MNIRIIAGKYGGRKIEAPDASNRRTHPMGERVRNAIFNSLGTKVRDAEVLDCFAGTGAIGLEALSRGAAQVTFIEKDRVAARILAGNIELLDAEDDCKLIRTSVNNWHQTTTESSYDVIFADPPYHDTQVNTLKNLPDRLKSDGVLVLSWPEKEEPPLLNDLEIVDQRVYAGAKILYYEFTELSTGK